MHDRPLDDRARELLAFEREPLTMPKERAIRMRFGITAARYHQELNRLIDLPEALAHDPMLVGRLRRLRARRRAKRYAFRVA